ncbi:peroxide stress protein YaaA [Massilia sp. TS11]|uniref:peroxide stress protein YaaA n=1 Tax=Massilia sp. TS11 TaxID=2908003 RepID=UPI001EDAC83F|nr:peroxide stress protein YaaA [Massilia sp. TS11]MCG2584565.1 peroxide stress protein YaaA [Massilia sp. TS11]
MLIVLSPAKSLDLDTPFKSKLRSTPDFLSETATLIDLLRELSPGQLSELMDLSDKLAVLNVGRYASWSGAPEHSRPAVMMFDGDVYDGLQARSLTPKQLEYAQQHVRILSGLYGRLRPMDLIEAHRLEMGTALANPRGKDLYAFWGERITQALQADIDAVGATALVNLASDEYFKSVKPKQLSVPVITPVFEDYKGGKYKIISFFAKRARGMMARYAAQKGLSDPAGLKRFKEDGYVYDKAASTDTTWVFRRKIAP